MLGTELVPGLIRAYLKGAARHLLAQVLEGAAIVCT